MISSNGASNTDHVPYNREIPQAYNQAEKELEREIYLETPQEMGLKEDEVLLAVKAL